MNERFKSLACEVRECRLCPRMGERSRVLSLANGPLNSKLMFIGEAPGRLGADNTQIPFHGDKAGANFEKLLMQVGLSRYDCFITNAVLCNPRGEEGNNAPPSRSELENCSAFLRRQIELINPSIVITLGAQSLAALGFIESHKLTLSESVRSANLWWGRVLIPLYHPGQRAMLHRSFLNQLADYQFVAETFRRKTAPARKRSKSSSTKSLEGAVTYTVKALIERGGEIGYFQLHKLFYLLEYLHFKETGHRFSRAYMVRQKDGPYVTDLHIATLRRNVESIVATSDGTRLVIKSQRSADLFSQNDCDRTYASLDPFISEVWAKYGSLSNEKLKAAVYMTGPMRSLLRAERYKSANTFNQPIEFS